MPAASRALACLLACVGVFGIDALLFRTHIYTSVLEPNSSTGLFELALWRERGYQTQHGDNMIETLGDSRFAYSPRLANALTPETGYVFGSAGAAGTDARSWYYMLRDLDPAARRYRAIVFGVNDYDDEDQYFEPDDDIRALHFAIARLRLSDAIDFAQSFHSSRFQWEAFRGALLKGIVYQSDIKAFLANPGKRIDYVRLTRGGYPEWTYNFVETDRSMAGLAIDWTNWKATFPPGFDENQRATVINEIMHRVAPQNGRLAAFRRAWFGKIIDRYRGSRTKIIFVRLARGPVLRPENLVKKRSSSIREFASRPNVLLCGEHAFDSLEHPEFFKDGLHLNREGTARFSPMFAREIAHLLADVPVI